MGSWIGFFFQKLLSYLINILLWDIFFLLKYCPASFRKLRFVVLMNLRFRFLRLIGGRGGRHGGREEEKEEDDVKGSARHDVAIGGGQVDEQAGLAH